MQEFETKAIEEIIKKVIQEQVKQMVAEAVEEYVRKGEDRAKEFSLLERIVRVEEELKALRQIESARFEAMEKRLSFMQWFMGVGFTVIVVLMSLINFLK